MTLFQSLWMAVLQGIAELFPISSLGHAVIIPALLGWHVNQDSPDFLPFLVVLHLGTATALVIYFWRDWLQFAQAAVGLGDPELVTKNRRLLGLIVVATIPAVVFGFLLEKELRYLFGSPLIAAAFLVINGGVLFIGERLKRRGSRQLASLTWAGALAIGVWQCTALIPGISRSGTTIVGGLLTGLHHKDAARFSFLIATPVIGGAGVLEIPKLFNHGYEGFGDVWIAGAVAAVTAYASVAFLMRYFHNHEIEALDPFAFYCWAVGALSLLVLLS